MNYKHLLRTMMMRLLIGLILTISAAVTSFGSAGDHQTGMRQMNFTCTLLGAENSDRY